VTRDTDPQGSIPGWFLENQAARFSIGGKIDTDAF